MRGPQKKKLPGSDAGRAAPAGSLQPGTEVGPYRIVRRLGAGGMGEVFLARDSRLDRDIALKFFACSLGDDEAGRARFARETRAVARLDHPNIVTLHETGDYQGRPYLVMQYVDGPSLGEFARGETLPVETVLDLGLQLCAGLQAAHEQGIVHRDVKPANILLDAQRRARLVDFGIARVAGAPALTATGATFGTAGYLPPEAVRGEEADARGDLFSLGVVLYELLTGHLPFAATSVAAYVYAVVHEPPLPLARQRGDVPPGLEPVLERALAKDRTLRYQTAAEFAADLKRVAGPPSAPAGAARPSVAVLPFDDMSPQRDQEYFCDGIAEELMNALARLEGLRVIARISAFAFKGTRADVREIGRKLGVTALLAGSVRKAGSRVRIAVQLVDAADASHLWTETYDRELEDIFAIQDEVCLSVAGRLKGTLLAGEQASVVRRRAADAGAYTLYLRARFLFNQRSEDGMRKSLEYYNQAIAADPRFALAYAGLAEAYEMLGSRRFLSLEPAHAAAREAASKALELDDSLAEAHTAAGLVRMSCDWDWAGAERELQRALAINPACAEAHHMMAHLHETLGRFDAALAAMDKALGLEPVAPGLHSCLAHILYFARRFDAAVRQCQATLEIAPSFAGIYGWLGMADVLRGRTGEGLAALGEGLRQRPGDPRLTALLATAHALAGDHAAARRGLAELEGLARQRYVDPHLQAWPRVALGDFEDAFAWLRRAHEGHSEWLYLLRVDPLLDKLRPDPRFVSLLEAMRLA